MISPTWTNFSQSPIKILSIDAVNKILRKSQPVLHENKQDSHPLIVKMIKMDKYSTLFQVPQLTKPKRVANTKKVEMKTIMIMIKMQTRRKIIKTGM